ncbi:MAG: phosphoribosylformylglycinamidine cyclo-ligase [Calditrichaeota bacterium]|nr:MAG: phosphoribosylformylglycinamidine cyclo-ligase [Calditrichota bacterium]
MDYKNAGVDIEASDALKKQLKNLIRESFTPQVITDIGLFGGFYRLDWQAYQHPVLVASMDGVGTKIIIAQMMGKYDTIGEDLVNHCINDIAVCGANPLFFLDYIAADKFNSINILNIISGIVRACKASRCSLIGGEMAQMPGVYLSNSFDLAGTVVGIVEKEDILDGSKIKAGDILIGVASNGLHTNGFSLVRKIFFEKKGYKIDQYFNSLNDILGNELLKVHKNYYPLIQRVRSEPELHGIAHITGGGIEGNTKRLLKDGLSLKINWVSWEVPAIFKLIQEEGQVTDEEMRRVFNLGVGLVLIIEEGSEKKFLNLCETFGEKSYLIGKIEKN